MATISPTVDTTISDSPRIIWSGVSTADTMTAFKMKRRQGDMACVQFTGTFGSATVKLQGSNDGTVFYDLKDLNGNAISATAAGGFEFKTSAIYIKPASSGGTADNVEVVVVLRGL